MSEYRRRPASVLVVLIAVSLLAACGGGRHIQSSPTIPPSPRPQSAPGAGTAPESSVSTARPAPTVTWSACHGAAGPQGYQCATVMVPRDPARPAGASVAMAIDRHRATGQKIGSLLVNPGGPGVSGVDFLPTVVGELPASLLARFDIVGFDPPGVDRTAPIACLSGTGLDRILHHRPGTAHPGRLRGPGRGRPNPGCRLRG